jgi:hypothetical protein
LKNVEVVMEVGEGAKSFVRDVQVRKGLRLVKFVRPVREAVRY